MRSIPRRIRSDPAWYAVAAILAACSSASDRNPPQTTDIIESGPGWIAVVEGRVLSSRGEPVDSVRITTEGRAGRMPFMSGLCLTNREGRYHCEIGGYDGPDVTPPPAEAKLRAMKQLISGAPVIAYKSDTLRFVVRGRVADTTRVDFVLPFFVP